MLAARVVSFPVRGARWAVIGVFPRLVVSRSWRQSYPFRYKVAKRQCERDRRWKPSVVRWTPRGTGAAARAREERERTRQRPAASDV